MLSVFALLFKRTFQLYTHTHTREREREREAQNWNSAKYCQHFHIAESIHASTSPATVRILPNTLKRLRFYNTRTEIRAVITNMIMFCETGRSETPIFQPWMNCWRIRVVTDCGLLSISEDTEVWNSIPNRWSLRRPNTMTTPALRSSGKYGRDYLDWWFLVITSLSRGQHGIYIYIYISYHHMPVYYSPV